MKEATYYKTISKPKEGFFKDRGSKFYGYAHHAKDEDEVQLILDAIKKEHIKARHFCYAYRIGEEGERFRINDDGEPSGTAGKPIYGMLIKKELTFSLIVVVRYFGGTKLGVPGLINAYRSAAEDAISNIKTNTILIGNHSAFETDYSTAANIIDEGKKLDMQLIIQNFTTTVKTEFKIPKADQEKRILQLLQKLTSLDFEEIEGYKDIVKVTTL